MPSQNPRRTFKYSRLTQAAHTIMDWIGSVQSLIVHTIFFVGAFLLVFFGFDLNKILLVVTTLVSFEAIYMAIFIQMALNQNTQSLGAVEEDIVEIQEDVQEIQQDVGEIEKDLDEIQKDVDELEKDSAEEQGDDEKHKMVMEAIESRLAKLNIQLEKMKDGKRD